MEYRYISIATAGHVDHGKTTLIRALTGKDTDTLKEEKIRGISIKLGFSSMILNEIKVSIVDVPGHEKFVPVMLKGMSGISAVLMVIAANEGIKKQTLEHLLILKGLEIENIIFVITKTDLVQDLDACIKDIKINIKKLGYKSPNILCVNSNNEKDIQILKDDMYKILSDYYIKKNKDESFLMFIDRKFNLKGIGDIVTGTISSGRISKSDDIYAYPMKKKIKIKNIQSFDKNIRSASVGERIALNIDSDNLKISVGNFLSSEGSLSEVKSCDVIIEELTFSNHIIKNLHKKNMKAYYGGTSFDIRLLKYDNERYCIYFEASVYINNSDKLILKDNDSLYIAHIIRYPSLRESYNKKNAYSILLCEDKFKYILKIIELDNNEIHSIDNLTRLTGYSKEKIIDILNKINVFYIDDLRYITCNELDEIYNKIRKNIAYLMNNNNFSYYIYLKDISYAKILGLNTLVKIIDYYKDYKLINIDGKPAFNNIECKYLKSGNYEVYRNEILKLFIHVVDRKLVFYHEIYNILDVEIKKCGLSNSKKTDDMRKEFDAVMDSILGSGEIIKVGESSYSTIKNIEDIISFIKLNVSSDKDISIIEIKNILNWNRRMVRELLQYTDNIGISKKCGGEAVRRFCF